MRIRPYRGRDISCIKEWITSERVHDMWCAGRLPYAFGEEIFGQKLKEEETEFGRSAFTIWHVDAVRLSVFENNAPARALYVKVGFLEEEYIPEAFSHGEEKWGRYLLCINRTKEK